MSLGGNETKKRQLTSGLVLLVVVLMLVAVYYFWVASRAPDDRLNTSPEILVNAQAANANQAAANTAVASDEEYKNTDLQFIVRHPAGWTVETSRSGSGTEEIFFVGLVGKAERLNISVLSETMEGLVRNSLTIDSEKSLTIDGVPATKLIGKSLKDGSPYSVVLVKRAGRLYSISGTGSAFEQIQDNFQLL